MRIAAAVAEIFVDEAPLEAGERGLGCTGEHAIGGHDRPPALAGASVKPLS
jgi:hypothetical protein